MFLEKYGDLVKLNFKNIEISKANPPLKQTKIENLLNPIKDKTIQVISLLDLGKERSYSIEKIERLIGIL